MRTPKTTRAWLSDSLGAFVAPTPLAPTSLATRSDKQDLAPTTTSAAELAPFQEAAVHRGADIVRRFGGVILADAVGLGKTRMALAMARILVRDDLRGTGKTGRVYICLPSRLRTTWRRAAREAGWDIQADLRLITHTELSRQDRRDETDLPLLVIVDEAHAFRNPDARRSANLARLTALAPTILLTATPISNGVNDLYHLLRLFLADHDLRDLLGVDLDEAFALAARGAYDLTELVEHLVIRRLHPPDEEGFGRRPSVSLEVMSYEPTDEEAWLWAHLPGELAQLNLCLIGLEWPRALFCEYVLRRWESGPEALAQTLKRLVDYHDRWLEASRQGSSLGRGEFKRLFGREEHREQGVFPFLYDALYDAGGKDAPTQGVLVPAVEADLEGLRALLWRANRVIGGGAGAAQAMSALIAAHRDEKFLIFSTYQQAARGLFDILSENLGPSRPIGLITGEGARATGLGRVNPEELLRRFAPIAHGAPPLPAHKGIDVLVCTDCLSEGVNLQDCSRIILADLPYSPLKVEQRIGRLVRPGAAHDRVVVYWLRPRQWQDTLGMRLRLDRKLDQAKAAGVDPLNATMIGSSPPQRNLNEPLAALTAQDSLARSLQTTPWSPPRAVEERYFRLRHVCDSYRSSPRPDTGTLYLRVFFDDGTTVQPLWCLVDEARGVRHRLGEVLPCLVALADLDGSIETCPAPTELLKQARAFLDGRRALLDAARLAPLALPATSPQQRLWRRLSEDAETIGAARLDALRPKLLRPYPKGLERRLEELLDRQDSTALILSRLEALPGLSSPPGPVSYRILWGFIA